MSGSHQWIPDLLTRRAHVDFNNGVDKVEQEVASNQSLDCHVQEHAGFSIRNQYPKILKKD